MLYILASIIVIMSLTLIIVATPVTGTANSAGGLALAYVIFGGVTFSIFIAAIIYLFSKGNKINKISIALIAIFLLLNFRGPLFGLSFKFWWSICAVVLFAGSAATIIAIILMIRNKKFSFVPVICAAMSAYYLYEYIAVFFG
jgi:hypothetical protein